MGHFSNASSIARPEEEENQRFNDWTKKSTTRWESLVKEKLPQAIATADTRGTCRNEGQSEGKLENEQLLGITGLMSKPFKTLPQTKLERNFALALMVLGFTGERSGVFRFSV